MDEVGKYHKEIVITKFGKPVAKLVPFEEPKKKPIFGCMKGTLKIHGDIMSTGEKWFADE
jgi:antitoxin (DNA-binding transcriptional repressor) of toxin-antitoxin stability system